MTPEAAARQPIDAQLVASGWTVRDFRIEMIPLLAEQRRIVAKVNELMAALDAIEAALTTVRTTAASLLAATVAKLHTA